MSLLQSLLTLGLLLPLPSLAQDWDGPDCANYTQALAYNATVTHDMPGFRVVHLGPEREPQVREYDGNWKVTARIGPPRNTDSMSENASTTIWIDAENANRGDRGGELGMCHNVISPQRYGRWSWSKEVLERSLDDNGDCKTMLGEECVEALEQHYTSEAGRVQNSEYQLCQDTNNTIPAECEGMLEQATSPYAPWFNATILTRFPVYLPDWENIPNTIDDSPLLCEGLNLTRSFGSSRISNVFGDLGITENYDASVNFPSVDIMNFFPREKKDAGFPMRQTHVVCLRPGSVVEGSREVKSAREMLDEMDGEGDDDGESAAVRFSSTSYLAAGFAVVLVSALIL